MDPLQLSPLPPAVRSSFCSPYSFSGLVEVRSSVLLVLGSGGFWFSWCFFLLKDLGSGGFWSPWCLLLIAHGWGWICLPLPGL